MPQQGVEAPARGSASKLSSTAPSFEPDVRERNTNTKKKSMNNSQTAPHSSQVVPPRSPPSATPNSGVAQGAPRESLLKHNQTHGTPPKGTGGVLSNNPPPSQGGLLTSPGPTTGDARHVQQIGAPSPYTQHQIERSLPRRNSASHTTPALPLGVGVNPMTPHVHGGLASSLPHPRAEFRRMSGGLGMMPSSLLASHQPAQSIGLYPGLQPQPHLMMGGIGQTGYGSLHGHGSGMNRRRDSHDSTGSGRSSFGRTRRKSSVTSDCVWVGNVCPSKSDEELKAKFEELGPVLTVRRFSRSHCAFIQFKTSSDAGKARMLENQLFGEMNLTVNIGQSSRHLWCGNVADGVTERDLVNHFGKFGQIQTVKIFQMNQCAFINFVHEPDARRALNALNNTMFHGNRIVLNYQWTRRTCLQKRGARNRSQSVDEKSLAGHRTRSASVSGPSFSSTRPIPPQVPRGRSRSSAGHSLVGMAHGLRERAMSSKQKMYDLPEEEPGEKSSNGESVDEGGKSGKKAENVKENESLVADESSEKGASKGENIAKEEIAVKPDKENVEEDEPGTTKQMNDKKKEEMSVASLRVDTSLPVHDDKTREKTMKARVAAGPPANTEKEKFGGRVLSPRTVQPPRARNLSAVRRGSVGGSSGNTPRDDDSQGSSHSYRPNPPSRQLYVGNISRQADTNELRKYFWRFGAIQKFRLFIERGFMFVIYTKQADAMRAKEHAETYGAIVSGRRLNVNYGNVLPDENARLPSPRNLFRTSPRHSKDSQGFFNGADANMVRNMSYPMVGGMTPYGAMGAPFMPAYGYVTAENGEMNVPYNMTSPPMGAQAGLYHPNSLPILQTPQGPPGAQQPPQTPHQTPQTHVYPATPSTPATPGSGPNGTVEYSAPAPNPLLGSPPNVWTSPGTPHGGMGMPGADYNMYATPHNTPQTPHTPANAQYNPYSHPATAYMMAPSMPIYDPYFAQQQFTAAQAAAAQQQQGNTQTPQPSAPGTGNATSIGGGAGGIPRNTAGSTYAAVASDRGGNPKDVPKTPNGNERSGGGAAAAPVSVMLPMVPQTPRGDEAHAWAPIDPSSYMVPMTPHAIPPSPGGPGLDMPFPMLSMYPPYVTATPHAGMQAPATPNATLVPMTPVSYLSPHQAQMQTIATQTQTPPNNTTCVNTPGDMSSTGTISSTPSQFVSPQQPYVPPFTQPAQGSFNSPSLPYAGLSSDGTHAYPTWGGGNSSASGENFSQAKFTALGANVGTKRGAGVVPAAPSGAPSSSTSPGYLGGGGLFVSPPRQAGTFSATQEDQRRTTSANVGNTRTQRYETGATRVNMFASPTKSPTSSRFLASPASPTGNVQDKQAKKPMSKTLLPPNAQVLAAVSVE